MKIQRLPESELEVMSALWDCEVPATRKDVEEKLHDEHPMAVTTVQTLLTRLAAKDFLRIEKNGRGAYYIPLVSKQEYLSYESSRLFSKLCGGNLSVFANALCDSGISKDDIEELKELLGKEEL